MNSICSDNIMIKYGIFTPYIILTC